VDIKNGGLDNWEELLTIKNSDIEPNVKTPTGGHHYYFRLKLGQEFTNSSGSLPEGIDIRANGGYVILPEVSTNYEQLKSFEDIREIPDWVVEHVVQKRENPISIIAKTSKIPVGNRNPTLFKESCALRRRGW
ncbi:MAG: bifunctional DNA primase/polymerase, partial [Desulfobacteraceae bacterium]|nr:bifunctional DNA primase/polymerase [Desulfobacteraceae bacterium]